MGNKLLTKSDRNALVNYVQIMYVCITLGIGFLTFYLTGSVILSLAISCFSVPIVIPLSCVVIGIMIDLAGYKYE